MNYWLVKTEPESFSWAMQVRHGVEPWTGVRNHRARRNLAAMAVGAWGAAGRPRGGWVAVDMRAVGPMARPVSLAAMKADPALADFELLRLSRLSVAVVSAVHWRHICSLGGFRSTAG